MSDKKRIFKYIHCEQNTIEHRTVTVLYCRNDTKYQILHVHLNRYVLCIFMTHTFTTG